MVAEVILDEKKVYAVYHYYLYTYIVRTKNFTGTWQ